MSAKHIVSSNLNSTNSYAETSLEPKEKKEIEEKTYHKDIIASSANLQVESLATNIRGLMFDEGIASDMNQVLGAYGMDRDVVNWSLSGSTTYENKSAAIVNFIQNEIAYEGADFANTMTNFFGYAEQGKKIVMTYDHLPAMAVLEEKKRSARESMSKMLERLVKAQVPLDQAMLISGLQKVLDDEKGK